MLHDEYQQWIDTVEPESRAGVFFSRIAQLTGELRYGVLACGSWTVQQLGRLVDALIAQDNECWEVVVSCHSGQNLTRRAAEYCREVQERITIVGCDDITDRSSMLQRLLTASRANWCLILDPEDHIVPTALREFDFAILQAPSAKLIYSDEDQINGDGKRSGPVFKPSYSPQMLQTYNYFGRLTVFNRRAALAIGGFQTDDGAGAEWGLHLRLSDAAMAEGVPIVRVPVVLCHRGAADRTDPEGPSRQTAADDRATLLRYWNSLGVPDARVTTMDDGTQRSHWRVKPQPLISVIIPSHNHPDLLRRCVEGLFLETDYENIEVIIVENNSTDASVWDLYEDLRCRFGVILRCWNRPFNYSAVCNYGAEVATGPLLLFLNNDIEIQDAGWLNEMVRVASLPSVGVVGLKLNYPDGVLQHAGVALGIHLYGLMFHRAEPETRGVFGSPGLMRNWMAVMGACQLVHRAVFDAVGRYDESYQIANSDVALCLRAVEAGWRVAYTPYASLIHHEGKTRGHVNPSRDMVRAVHELQRLGIREDPFLHPQLSSGETTPRLIKCGERSISDNLAHLMTHLLLIDLSGNTTSD